MAHIEQSQRNEFAEVCVKADSNALPALRVEPNGEPDSSVNAGAEILVYPNPLLETQPVGGKLKRTFDVLAASALLILASPLIMGVVLAAKAADSGPLLYEHTRTGFRGRDFQCLKFRTMLTNADAKLAHHLAVNPEAAKEWSATRKLRNDPRVTPVGVFLRKTSLDELPQLINVVRGDMSLVGPRPVPMAELLQLYGARRFAYLAARPGVSGLWQVSGRSATTYERRTELDELYVRNWSFWQDVKIILRTIPELLPSSRAF